MHSKFVTNLKYAFQNDESLFLVLDLMEGKTDMRSYKLFYFAVGGDLNFHLKKRGKLTEAEVILYV